MGLGRKWYGTVQHERIFISLLLFRLEWSEWRDMKTTTKRPNFHLFLSSLQHEWCDESSCSVALLVVMMYRHEYIHDNLCMLFDRDPFLQSEIQGTCR